MNAETITKIADELKCTMCKQFYGYKEGKLCSHCYEKKNGNYEEFVKKVGRINTRKIPKRFNIKLLMDKGFHSEKLDKCTICLDDKTIYSKWYCRCSATCCTDCIKAIELCPICKSNIIVPYEKFDILYLFENKFSKKAQETILLKYIKKYNIKKGIFSLSNIITTCDTIEELLKFDKKYDEFNLNTPYSLAVDFWNTSTYAYCYKFMNIEHLDTHLSDIIPIRYIASRFAPRYYDLT